MAQVFRSARGEALTELGQEGLQVAGAMTQGGEYTAQELVERGGMLSCSAAQWVAAQEQPSTPQAQSAAASLAFSAVAAAHQLTQKLQQNLRSVSRPSQKVADLTVAQSSTSTTSTACLRQVQERSSKQLTSTSQKTSNRP